MNAVKMGIPVERMYYHTPLGKLKITATEQGISAVQFTDEFESPALRGVTVENCIHELGEYFAGKRTTFSLKFDLQGTDFQKRVWTELLNIPFGKTISYLELARRLGDEKVIRAAGSANGKNPIAIILPCHRVIGSTGKLTGFAAGLDVKAQLLEMEGATEPELKLGPTYGEIA